MKFSKIVIEKTIEKLIAGEDYREEIINAINLEFLDFTLDFFKKILDAKLDDKNINLDWYRKSFINNPDLDSNESVIFAGINKKSIHNIYGKSTKKVMLDVANANIDYLESLIGSLDDRDM